MVLSMLRSFGKIGPQIDQIWAWLSRGHRWSPEVRNPLKSSVTGPSLLVNCYLEIKFHKIIRVNPPLNMDLKFEKRAMVVGRKWSWYLFLQVACYKFWRQLNQQSNFLSIFVDVVPNFLRMEKIAWTKWQLAWSKIDKKQMAFYCSLVHDIWYCLTAICVLLIRFNIHGGITAAVLPQV